MSDDTRQADSGETRAAAQHDSQRALDAELQRETERNADGIGDMRENRNLSGSATWETLMQSSSSNEGSDRPEVF